MNKIMQFYIVFGLNWSRRKLRKTLFTNGISTHAHKHTLTRTRTRTHTQPLGITFSESFLSFSTCFSNHLLKLVNEFIAAFLSFFYLLYILCLLNSPSSLPLSSRVFKIPATSVSSLAKIIFLLKFFRRHNYIFCTFSLSVQHWLLI